MGPNMQPHGAPRAPLASHHRSLLQHSHARRQSSNGRAPNGASRHGGEARGQRRGARRWQRAGRAPSKRQALAEGQSQQNGGRSVGGCFGVASARGSADGHAVIGKPRG